MNDLSIDIGGTKIRVIEYNPNFDIINKAIFATKDIFKNNTEQDLNDLLQLIHKKYSNNYNKIGVSINSAVKDNIIFYSEQMGGKVNFKLDEKLCKIWKYKTLISDNDVICMAKAEIEFGLGKEYNNFLYINLGTGIRMCYVENSIPIRGVSNLAGEISQQQLWVKELNKFIELEKLVSGKGVEWLNDTFNNKTDSAKRIFQNDHPQIIKMFVRYLSRVITNSNYYYNPEIIVLGGSLTLSADRWLPSFKKVYKNDCHSLFCVNKIMITKIKYPASLGALLNM